MLYCLNAFERFGPRILPIIGTFRSMLPFVVVVGFFVAAFSHSGWVIHICQPLQQVYRLALLAEPPQDITTLVGVSDTLQQLWFVFGIFVLTVALLNVFIGVMSESYERHQDQSSRTFLMHRATFNLRSFLQSGSALKSKKQDKDVMTNARKTSQITFNEAYVWVCHTSKDADDFNSGSHGRIAMLKRHSEEQTEYLMTYIERVRGDCEAVVSSIDYIVEKQIQYNDSTRAKLMWLNLKNPLAEAGEEDRQETAPRPAYQVPPLLNIPVVADRPGPKSSST